MEFAFSEEQLALKDNARRFLAQNAPTEAVRSALAEPWSSSFAADLWRRMASELGWTSLVIDERYGGAGYGNVALAALMEELGRALTPVPFLSTVCLATHVLSCCGSEQQKQRHLPAIASGELTGTWLQLEQGEARREGDQWQISGRANTVLDGQLASLLIVTAPCGAGSAVASFIVPAQRDGVGRRALSTMDATRRMAEVTFDAVRVGALDELGAGIDAGPVAHADRALARAHDLTRVALAAEQLGGADRCLEMAVDYAKERKQFGRPIGSFQAIKHKCADMLVQVECARSAAYYAAWVADNEPAALPVAAAMAKVACSEAYFYCAAENIQIHGGIGFTWEHDAHLHFKRARASEGLFGTPSALRETLAEAVGL